MTDAGQIAFSTERGDEYWGYVLVKELGGVFVWLSCVAFAANPPDIRVRDGWADTWDEAKKQGTDWCQRQIEASKKQG